MSESASQPLSDADLIAWSVVLTRRTQQERDGINLLLLPYPPCPTCGEPVHEADQVITERPDRLASDIRLTMQPCGHVHTTTDEHVRRLRLHLHEMTSDVASGYHGHAVEARRWTTEEIVREARARAAGTATDGADYPAHDADEQQDRLASLRKHAAQVSKKTGLTVTVEPFHGRYAVTVNRRGGGGVRHGGYSWDAVHGMLLGIAATGLTAAPENPHECPMTHMHVPASKENADV